MITCFKNISLFTVTFFVALFIDILVKVNFGYCTCRLVSKSLIVILLLTFYLVNKKELSRKKRIFMVTALLFFLAGDILLIFYEVEKLYMLGMSCFILGKVFYIFRFSNRRDFDLLRLLPFLILCFFYMVGVLYLMLNNLNSYFYVILVYLFVALTVVIFGLLRKSAVNRKSYYLVLIGILFSIFSDSITGLSSFYHEDIAYQAYTIMAFYGLSQYFIVLGIVKEVIVSPVIE